MWHIYDCLYRDRWASHRLGSTVKRNVCESDVQPQILSCSWYESWGGCWPTACAPPSKGFVWACCAAGLTTVYYLYHLRGLTGLGLVLFHPNIIILWQMHNWIGVWGTCGWFYIRKWLCLDPCLWLLTLQLVVTCYSLQVFVLGAPLANQTGKLSSRVTVHWVVVLTLYFPQVLRIVARGSSRSVRRLVRARV